MPKTLIFCITSTSLCVGVRVCVFGCVYGSFYCFNLFHFLYACLVTVLTVCMFVSAHKVK